jgi:hypothetical protein
MAEAPTMPELTSLSSIRLEAVRLIAFPGGGKAI